MRLLPRGRCCGCGCGGGDSGQPVKRCAVFIASPDGSSRWDTNVTRTTCCTWYLASLVLAAGRERDSIDELRATPSGACFAGSSAGEPGGDAAEAAETAALPPLPPSRRWSLISRGTVKRVTGTGPQSTWFKEYCDTSRKQNSSSSKVSGIVSSLLRWLPVRMSSSPRPASFSIVSLTKPMLPSSVYMTTPTGRYVHITMTRCSPTSRHDARCRRSNSACWKTLMR